MRLDTAFGFLTGLCAALALAVLVAALVAGPVRDDGVSALAAAAAGATAPPRAHDSIDFNGDGALSLAEVAGNPYVVGRFERADRNKDGKLSAREMERLSKLPEKPARKAAKKARS